MGISDKKVTGGWTDGTSINEVAVRRGCTVFMISWVGGARCPGLETLTLIQTTSYDFPHAITPCQFVSEYETDSLPKCLYCNVENSTNCRSSPLKLAQVAGSEIEMKNLTNPGLGNTGFDEPGPEPQNAHPCL